MRAHVHSGVCEVPKQRTEVRRTCFNAFSCPSHRSSTGALRSLKSSVSSSSCNMRFRPPETLRFRGAAWTPPTWSSTIERRRRSLRRTTVGSPTSLQHPPANHIHRGQDPAKAERAANARSDYLLRPPLTGNLLNTVPGLQTVRVHAAELCLAHLQADTPPRVCPTTDY